MQMYFITDCASKDFVPDSFSQFLSNCTEFCYSLHYEERKSIVQLLSTNKSFLGEWKGFFAFETNNEYIFIDREESFFVSCSCSFSQVSVYFVRQPIGIKRNRVLSEILQYICQQRLIMQGNVMIHAAVPIYNNHGVAFCGESGAGKSTQANLWCKYLNAKILNYDKPYIKLNNKELLICGTPWSGKERVYANREYPLDAIVFVEKAKSNYIRRMSYAQAFTSMNSHFLSYPINEDLFEKYTQIIEEIANRIPVYELECCVNEGAVQTVYTKLFGNDYSKERDGVMSEMKIKQGLRLRNIAGEYVAISTGKEFINYSTTVIMNETSAFLWKLLEKGCSKEELINELTKEYEVNAEEASRDIDSFLNELHNSKYLEESNE